MIPVVGSAATGAKYVNKGLKYGEEIADAGKTIKKDTPVDEKQKWTLIFRNQKLLKNRLRVRVILLTW